MEHKTTLSDRFRVWFRGLGEAGAKFLLRLGLTANMATIIGCVGHIGAFWTAYRGRFRLTCLLLLVFSLFDFFDGTMARMTTGGKGSKFGAVLDSALDRYAEALLLGGLMCHYAERGNVPVVALCLAAMTGAFLVPYLRAKGELYGLDMTVGLMSKLERTLVLGLFLLLSLPVPGLAILAVLNNFTAMQRLLYIRKHLEQEPERKQSSESDH